jgi:hypothetical protein
LLAGLVGATAILGGCKGSGEEPPKAGVVATALTSEACTFVWGGWYGTYGWAQAHGDCFEACKNWKGDDGSANRYNYVKWPSLDNLAECSIKQDPKAFTVKAADNSNGLGSIAGDPNAPYCPVAGDVAEEENFFQGGGSVCGSSGQQPDILYQDGIPN